MKIGRPSRITPEVEAILGTMIDARVARVAGVSISTVHNWRVARGIPAHRRHHNRNPSRAIMNCPFRDRLGKETDQAIATDHGLTRSRVHQYRKALGIAPCQKVSMGQLAYEAAVDPEKSWRQIEEEAGAGRDGALSYASRRGLPLPPKRASLLPWGDGSQPAVALERYADSLSEAAYNLRLSGWLWADIAADLGMMNPCSQARRYAIATQSEWPIRVSR